MQSPPAEPQYVQFSYPRSSRFAARRHNFGDIEAQSSSSSHQIGAMFSGLFKKNVATVQMLNKATQNVAQNAAQNVAQLVKPMQQKEDDSSSEEDEAMDDSPEVAKYVD